MNMPARVLLVDDHTLYREGLREILSNWDDFHVVGEAVDGEEAVVLCRSLVPDIVLMDIQMPVMDGIEATRIIHGEFPDIAIVVLSISSDETHVMEALFHGAMGYVLKDSHACQLHDRLQAVVRGEAVLSGVVTKKFIDEYRRQQLNGPAKRTAVSQVSVLSDRERDILRLLAGGMSNEDIGRELFISESAVKKQVGNIMRKLGADNRVQLAVLAVRSGIAE